MIDQERIRDLCERLGISTMGRDFPALAERAAKDELGYQAFFETLLQCEFRDRQERSRTLLTRTAGFPAIKTLEQYDFKFASGAPRALVTEPLCVNMSGVRPQPDNSLRATKVVVDEFRSRGPLAADTSNVHDRAA